MSNRTLMMLLAAALAMGLIAYVAQRPEAPVDDMIGSKVMPGLDLSTVAAVGLRSRDDETRLERTADGFVVVERGYPANFTRVSALLNDLASATWRERKTALPRNHHALGVRDIESEGSEAVEVSVYPGGTGRLVVGNEAAGDGVFVRQPGEDQVWLIDRIREVAADPAVWLEPVIINVESENVSRVRFETGSDVLTAARDGESGDMVIADVPAGRTLQYGTVANSLARALVNVRLEDVRPRADDFEADITASFTLASGAAVEVYGHDGGAGNRWLRFEVTRPDDPTMPADDGLSDGTIKRLQGFDFRVRQFVWDAFAKTWDDVLAPAGEDDPSTADPED